MKDLPPGHYPAPGSSVSSDLSERPVVQQRRDEPSEQPAKPRRPRPCPICAKLSLPDTYPFCSKRCADVDLHRWLSGSYAIPAVEEDPGSDETFPGPSED